MKQTIYIPVKVEEGEWWNDGEGARIIFDRFKKETPTHKTMVASKFWSAYQTWLAYNLLRELASKKPVEITEEGIYKVWRIFSDTVMDNGSEDCGDYMSKEAFFAAIIALMKGEK